MNTHSISDRLNFPKFRENGLCAEVDPELFFPDKGGSTRAAKGICARCPVKQECLEFALDDPGVPFGIWGGMSERERRRLKRDRKNRKAAA